MSTHPTDAWDEEEWAVAIRVFEGLPDSATVKESREAIDAALTEFRAAGSPQLARNHNV